MSNEFLTKYRDQMDLTDADIAQLESIIATLDSYANLCRDDLFVDCFLNDDTAIVVGHGRPSETSIYHKNIAGEMALPANEPLVFSTREYGVPLKEGGAISQENRAVIQRTNPIFSETTGKIIGVLIQEEDITTEVSTSNKLNYIEAVTQKLVSEKATQAGIPDIRVETDTNSAMIQEIHHRIKNNLQTISSIINMQKRQCTSEEAKEILSDTSSRLASVASMYECLIISPGDIVDVYNLSDKILKHCNEIHNAQARNITLTLKGDHLELPYEKVQSVAIILNELLQNAFRHGLTGRDSGAIEVIINAGNLYSTIVVTNTGNTFDPSAGYGFGITLSRAIAKSSLKGSLEFKNTEALTSAFINILM